MKDRLPGLIDIEIKDGIVIGHYAMDLVLDIKNAKQIVAKRLELQQGNSYPVLIYISLKSSTREARNYMKKEGLEGITAGAFIVGNTYTLFITNFFLSLVKPKVPSKIFRNSGDALNWLKQFKKY